MKRITINIVLCCLIFLLKFSGLQAQTVTDIDGNVYHTIKIGTQVWMVENLKTTRYNDGTRIPNVTDNKAWSNLTTPAYCWYNNDATNYKDSYGALYNWQAVNTGKLAPEGWHVATNDEWARLIVFLGGESVAGCKLKEVGTSHWLYPNTGATNETGFTGLPGGYRYNVGGSFVGIGKNGIWWSATEAQTNYACVWVVYNDASYVDYYGYTKRNGLSVRCVKDN